MRSSRQKASFVSKWFVNDPCGTPAARTISRTVAPQYPCSSTTLKPSASIFSRSDGLGMLAPAGLRRRRGDLHQQTTTSVVRNQTIQLSLLIINIARPASVGFGLLTMEYVRT